MNNVSLNSNENTQQTLLKENQLNEFDENSAKVRSKKFQITKIFNKVEHFLKQIRNAFKSVIPDLKSLKTWQILILCLFALFNFTFSILVRTIEENELIHELSFRFFSRISIFFFDEKTQPPYSNG